HRKRKTGDAVHEGGRHRRHRDARRRRHEPLRTNRAEGGDAVKLYNYWRSSASWRVRIALAYKNVAYEYVAVNIMPGVAAQTGDDYKKMNPMAQVPTLVLDDGRQLAQSLAILE